MSILIYKPASATLLLLCLSLSSTVIANVFVNPRSNHLNLYLGSYDAETETGVLENPSSNIAIGLSSSAQSRRHPFLAIDMELWLLATEYNNTLSAPLLVSTNDDMELETSAITFGARLMYPHDARYRFYISGGFGYFHSELRVRANVSDTISFFEDSTQEFAPYLGAGITFNLGYRQTLELFYRRWDTQGNFSKFNIPETDIGGEAFGIGFGMYW